MFKSSPFTHLCKKGMWPQPGKINIFSVSLRLRSFLQNEECKCGIPMKEAPPWTSHEIFCLRHTSLLLYALWDFTAFEIKCMNQWMFTWVVSQSSAKILIHVSPLIRSSVLAVCCFIQKEIVKTEDWGSMNSMFFGKFSMNVCITRPTVES